MKWSGHDDAPSWEGWLLVPVTGYLETGRVGPVPFREVEWVELDSRQKNERGRLVVADQTDELACALARASVEFQVTEGVFRITPSAGDNQPLRPATPGLAAAAATLGCGM